MIERAAQSHQQFGPGNVRLTTGDCEAGRRQAAGAGARQFVLALVDIDADSENGSVLFSLVEDAFYEDSGQFQRATRVENDEIVGPLQMEPVFQLGTALANCREQGQAGDHDRQGWSVWKQVGAEDIASEKAASGRGVPTALQAAATGSLFVGDDDGAGRGGTARVEALASNRHRAGHGLVKCDAVADV